MRSISIPIRIQKGGLARTDKDTTAIDSALSLLLTTPCYSSAADPRFGFIFNNLRFEIVNENEGVMMNSAVDRKLIAYQKELYDKKISGSSTNINTFAAILKQSIELYEKRLRDVAVSMTYIREQRTIYVTVKAVIAEDGTPYQYTTTISVWK